MQHPLGMGRVDRAANLAAQVQHHLRREPSGPQPIPEGLAPDQFHCQEQDFRSLGRSMERDIVHAAHARMTDAARQQYFTSEAFGQRPRVRGFGPHDLHRDAFAQHRVVRLVHFAHAAAAEEADDGETPRDDIADGQDGDCGRVPKRARRDLKPQRRLIRKGACGVVQTEHALHLARQRGVVRAMAFEVRGASGGVKTLDGLEQFPHLLRPLRRQRRISHGPLAFFRANATSTARARMAPRLKARCWALARRYCQRKNFNASKNPSVPHTASTASSGSNGTRPVP